MNNDDVKLGMKVVLKSKSINCRLRDSDTYQRMIKQKQPFVYVCHRHAQDVACNYDRWLLDGYRGHIHMCGDYFKSCDFEPYTGIEADPEFETILNDIREITGFRYDDTDWVNKVITFKTKSSLAKGEVVDLITKFKEKFGYTITLSLI